MPLDVPNLDDRTWAQLVDEARALIPRLAPAWTDHNVHDPGMTLIELFAWLAEMQLYQLNRVSERHREVFARLAGVERFHRIPARVALRVEGQLAVGTRLPAGTQLTPGTDDELIFETDTDVALTASQLWRVVVDDGISVVDQTDANRRSGVAFLAFGETAGPGAALQLGFDGFYPSERELRLTFDVFDDDLTPPCELTGASRPDADMAHVVATPPVELVWELRSATAAGWSPLNVLADSTHALLSSGVVTIATPRATVQDRGPVWIRARIARGSYDIEPRLRNIAVNVVPCSQRQTVRHEHLNAFVQGEGRPNQAYTLVHKPLMQPLQSAPVRLEGSDVVDWDLLVQEVRRNDPELAQRVLDARREPNGPDVRALAELNRDVGRALDAAGPLLGRDPIVVTVDGELWQRVESFALSHPASAHFVLEVDSGRVLFGNGLNGRIPAKDADIRAVWYRTCAGAHGNVAAGQSWRSVAGGLAVTLQNTSAASGGADPETLDELALRAQASLRRPNRGVTARDLERLAIETPLVHVARAKTVPGHPNPETITVVVLPKARPGRPRPRATISAAFLDQVRRHLERHRLLCDQLRVVAPAFVEVSVTARLMLVKGASPASVTARASETLDRFLRGELDLTRDVRVETLPPLLTPCPTRWPFGRAVRLSEVYAALESVTGVDTVWGVTLAGRSGGAVVPADNSDGIPVPTVGLVLAGTHHLVVDDGPGGGR